MGFIWFFNLFVFFVNCILSILSPDIHPFPKKYQGTNGIIYLHGFLDVYGTCRQIYHINGVMTLYK